MTTTLPPRPRFPRWAKVTVGLLMVVLVPCGFLLAWFVVAMSGGVDDLLSGRVDADDDRVVAAREVAERDLTLEVGTLPSGTDALAQTSHSACETGQHNWKIDDDFDLYCTQAHAVVLPADDLDGFRDDAMALHQALVADGWAAAAAGGAAATTGLGEPDIPDLLQEYWDPRGGDVPEADYSPDDLPGASYVRGSSRLVVTWLEPGAEASLGYPLRDAVWQTPEGDRTGYDLGTLVPAASYAPTLTLSTEYFRE